MDAPRPLHKRNRRREITKATRASPPTLRVRPQSPRRGDGFSLHRPYNDKKRNVLDKQDSTAETAKIRRLFPKNVMTLIDALLMMLSVVSYY